MIELAPTASQSKLNLGCGDDQPHDWHNVDVEPGIDPDEVVDLEETPWPWQTNQFGVIRAHHVLEHLDPVLWDELVRVLAHDGVLEWQYPIGHTRFEDPTHKQFWNVLTAETITGARKHGHEHVPELDLIDRDVEWSLAPVNPLINVWVRLRIRRHGYGPWLSQIPGLYGHVTAHLRNNKGENR